MADVELRLQQVATVITQLDDPKVPRNIRKGAKDSIDEWLLIYGTSITMKMTAMTQNKLEELFEDPNIPPEFCPLILMITTELERLLTQI